jgi:hypothetical protein
VALRNTFVTGDYAAGKIINPNDVGHDLIVIVGQPNALGAGEGTDLTYLDTTSPRVRQWPGSGSYQSQIATAVDPLIHQQTASGIGFGMTFGRDYVKTAPENRTALIVNSARGETAFLGSVGYTWDPNSTDGTKYNLYNYAIAQTAAALASGTNNRIAAIRWLQGEGDTTVLDQAGYAAKLDSLIAGFRAQFGATIPFIVGQINPDRMSYNSGYPLINARIDTPRRNLYSGSRTAFRTSTTAMPAVARSTTTRSDSATWDGR